MSAGKGFKMKSSIMRQQILLVFGLAASGQGVANEIDKLLGLSLEELLKTPVTTATLSSQDLRSVPASITVFTRNRIRQLGVKTLEDLMNHVPGYQSYNIDNFMKTYSSRSRRLVGGNREVLLLIDGQRANHDMLGTSVVYEESLPLDNVERVEFMRGPGSALYGANAFLGVVNVITTKQRNDVTVNAGQNGLFRSALNVSQRMDSGWQHSLFAQQFQTDGEKQALFDSRTGDYINDQQAEKLHNLYWQATWGDWAMQVRHTRHVNEGGYVVGSVADDMPNYSKTTSSLFALNYDHVIDNDWMYSGRIYHSPYTMFYRLHTPNQINASPRLVDNDGAGDETGFDNRFFWHGENKEALIGIDYMHSGIDKGRAQVWMPPAAPGEWIDAYDLDSFDMAALYTQWQGKLVDEVTYILGARQDHYFSRYSHTSPRIGLVWAIDTANHLKLLYGEAFRAPAANERSIKNSTTQLGNPDLKPEVSKTAELIWLYSSSSRYSSISLFDTIIDDPVALQNTLPPQLFINQGQQHFSGLEVGEEWYFNEHFQVVVTATRLFNSPISNNLDSERLLGVSLLFQQEPFSGSVSAHYFGPREDMNTVTPTQVREWGGYTLFDFALQYPLSRQLELTFEIRNLGDKAYTQPAQHNPLNDEGVPGLSRELEFGIKYRFEN